ncbi:TIGR01777 family oxidoreductase [Paenibacillus sp. KQZ6P-2]|uniref:TIGR01777 family oxidoreductase n=1 Tax=Paenibacillus mangrovi TaxID=2931978 RepID=A0A9X1WPR0_9BACL|nr:TIGR01777 family oxidoreductase [Paenibacillus mangrovi]MCJ8013147.1 TIGR01777 family oxidoreductase [Paenibacillus mangrovi]
MKITICGGTGFIGKALSDHLLQQGHEVTIITRKIPELDQTVVKYLTWEQIDAYPELLEGTEALINLAGSSLNQRWTPTAKKSIIESRMTTVQAVAKLVQALHQKPEVVVQASAIAIYGTSLTDTFSEDSPAHVADFPSSVVKKWEDTADLIQEVRLIKLRTSVVLGTKEGAFPLMKLPYLLGFGGRIGSGQQWVSWIHLQDMVRLIEFCITQSDVSGPVNASAPEPVTNNQFGQTVGRVYHRPHWFPVPSFMMKTVLGELSLIILEGQRIMPDKVLKHGFHFDYPTLEQALRDLKEHQADRNV